MVIPVEPVLLRSHILPQLLILPELPVLPEGLVVTAIELQSEERLIGEFEQPQFFQPRISLR